MLMGQIKHVTLLGEILVCQACNVTHVNVLICFSLVDKWIKQNKMDFLGIPSCVGFGLHAESYRCENVQISMIGNIKHVLLLNSSFFLFL